MKPLTRKQRIAEELLSWLIVTAMAAAALGAASLLGGCASTGPAPADPLPIEWYD